MRLAYSLLGPVLLAALSLPALSQSVLQPGAWEQHLEGAVQDPQTGQFRTMQNEQRQECLTEAFLKTAPYLDPTIQQRLKSGSGDCRISDDQHRADAANWRMACTAADGTRRDIRFEATASATSFTSVLQSTELPSGDPARTVEVRFQTRMTRLGECTPGMRTP